VATDATPPRHALILGIAIASALTLGTLKLIFDWYYKSVMEAEVAAKAAPPMELKAARLAEQQRLTSGPMPIDKAMQDLAKSREALITPEQSTDEGPLVGWSKSPRPVPAPAAAGDGGAMVAPAADAGAMVAGDAGVTPTAGDAGTKPHPVLGPAVPIPPPGPPGAPLPPGGGPAPGGPAPKPQEAPKH
jgi:hypothetical protein